MYIYILIIFILGWIVYPLIIRRYGKKHANLFFLIILFPVCVFAMGLRSVEVGVDTIEYQKIFNDYVHYSWTKVLTDDSSEDRIELGFKVLMKLCADIIPNYYFYQIVFSIIYISLSFNFLYQYTSNTVLTTAIFIGGGMYMQAFNIARQMLAVVIVAYAIVSILQEKTFKALVIIGIAYLFHSASLIVLIALMVFPFRKIKSLMTIFPILLIIFILLIDKVLLPIAFILFDEKYIDYILNDYSRPQSGIMIKIMWIINFIIAIIAFYKNKNPNILLLAFLTLVSVGCFWVGLSINYVDRMGLYFLPCIILLYDKMSRNIKEPLIKWCYCNCLSLFYIINFSYWTYINKAVSYNSIIY